jgi:hypothetical protein
MASKKATSVEYTCEFCKKAFKQERTLVAHVCDKKLRWLHKDERYSRMGLHAYQKFYELSMHSKKAKSFEEFMHSKYYASFIKFGRHLLHINALQPEGFVEFLIKAQVKIEDWTQDWAYETWVRELSKRESPEAAVTRSIQLMEQWARENEEPWQDFFRKVAPAKATTLIRTGRLSPWLLYAGAGDELFDRMSDEQLELVKEWINPVYWQMKIRENKDEVDFIKGILQEAGV